MKRENIRKMLRNYSEVSYTKHAEIRCIARSIPSKIIEENLLNPGNLIHAKQEGELKYKLYFSISHARTLMVIVSLQETIKVITAKIIINKMQKGLWSRWQ